MDVSAEGSPPGSRGPGDVSRRAFMLAAAGAAVSTAGSMTEAFRGTPSLMTVSRLVAEVPDLPAPLAGLTVAHLTDLHLHDGMHPAARRAMEVVAGLEPDITFATGDLCERPSQLGELASWLRVCRGRIATVVTMGNHERFGGLTPGVLRRIAEGAGAAFLHNESLIIQPRGVPLALVGLDDARAGRPDPMAATAGIGADVPAIWGFHAPGYADRLRDHPVSRPILALAGHTHGGQIRLPLLPPVTPRMSGRFVAGWYRDTFAPLYVTRGIGTSGVRARFRCPPEIALVTLMPA